MGFSGTCRVMSQRKEVSERVWIVTPLRSEVCLTSTLPVAIELNVDLLIYGIFVVDWWAVVSAHEP